MVLKKAPLFLGLAVLLASCASLYFDRITPPDAPLKIVDLGELPYRELWSGFVFNGEKVGFTFLRIEPLPEEGLYRITSEARMLIRFLGIEKKVSMRSVDVVRPDLTLFSFHYEQSLGDGTMVLEGVVANEILKTAQQNGDLAKTAEHRFEGPIYPTSVINLYPVLHGLKIGATYRFQVFDPQVQAVAEVYQTVKSFEESEKLVLERSFRVVTHLHGHKVSSWINQQGETIFELAMGGVLITFKESEETARRYLSEASLNKKDLILDFSLIRTETPIPCPRDVTNLKVAVEGLPDDLPLLEGPRQTVQPDGMKGDNAVVYELRRALAPEPREAGEPVSDELKTHLKSTYHIERDHPEIIRTAEEIASGATTRMETVRRLVKWVSDEVEDEVTESTSALEVLHKKKGECQAHTLLYAALARARGIPTRLAGGLVYVEEMGFLYHSWAESYLDGWVAVDPAFNQVGVDATHIKLVQGNSWLTILQIGKVVGKINIEVLGFEGPCGKLQ